MYEINWNKYLYAKNFRSFQLTSIRWINVFICEDDDDYNDGEGKKK